MPDRTESVVDDVVALRRLSRALEEWWRVFDVRCSDPRCDKHAAGFYGDNRYMVVSLGETEFSACLGGYGSSSCATFSGGITPAAASFLRRAVNLHARDLFQTAAKLAREEAVAKVHALRERHAEIGRLIRDMEEEAR